MSQPRLVQFATLSFAYFAALGLFAPYASLWFSALGFSTIAIGVISALQSCSRLVAPYAWSWAGDHSGRRVELIRIATLGCMVSALGLLGVKAAVPVALMTGLLFLSNSGVVPLYETVLAHLLQTEHGMDRARYGRVRMWGSVGFIVSVGLFGAWFQWAGIETFPWMVAAMNSFLLWAAFRLSPTRESAIHDEPPPPVLGRLLRPEVQWFFASIFFTVLAHSVMGGFFSLYLESLGYGPAATGALWALAVAAEILFFATQGRWLRSGSPHDWLVFVAAVTLVRFSVTAGLGNWTWMLILAQLTHSVTFAGHHATCIALISRYFPDRARGRGQALYAMLGYGVPGVLGGLGGGWIISHLGFEAAFWASAASGALALLASWKARQLDLTLEPGGDGRADDPSSAPLNP